MKSKTQMKYKLLYDKSTADCRRLRRQLQSCQSLLTISDQKFATMSAAFDLSQKLVQHLKTENQLLKSAAANAGHDFMPHLTAPAVVGDHQSLANNCNDNKVNGLLAITDGHCIGDTPLQTLPSMTESMHTIATNDVTTAGDDPSKTSGIEDMCQSDRIAIDWENEIKDLRDDCDLLCLFSVQEVVVTREDQLNASSHLSLSEDDGNDTDNNTDVEDMDVDDKSSPVRSRPKCRLCGRKFDTEPALKDHTRQHKAFDPKQVRCAEDMCGHQFDTSHQLRDHLKAVHLSVGKSPQKGPKSLINKTFECKECSRSYPSMQTLREHQKSLHNMISSFRCKFSGCDHTFEKVLDLKAHEEQHRKNHTAIDFKQQSKKGTPTVSPDIAAKASVPTPKSEPKFKCRHEGCTSQYTTKRALVKHEDRPHVKGSTASDGSAVDVTKDLSAITAPTDPKTQLMLLQMFYESQKQKTEL